MVADQFGGRPLSAANVPLIASVESLAAIRNVLGDVSLIALSTERSKAAPPRLIAPVTLSRSAPSVPPKSISIDSLLAAAKVTPLVERVPTLFPGAIVAPARISMA